jgi:hypothetical protein
MLAMRITRRFFLRAKTSITPSSNSGATTTSAYCLAIASAVALSTARLQAMHPPKAATRSARLALR